MESLISNIIPPLPDELLYSWVIRLAKVNGMPPLLFYRTYFQNGDSKCKAIPTDIKSGFLNFLNAIQYDNAPHKLYFGLTTMSLDLSALTQKNQNDIIIKFFNDEDCTDKYKVNFGWGRQNKYVLKANWTDKTHSRNIVTAHIAAQVQDKYNLFQNTPNNGLIDGFPVEVYLNNEFHGLYTLNIPKEDWLYGMDDNNPNHIIMVGEKYSTATTFKEVNIDGWNNQLDDNSPTVQQKMLRLINFVVNSTDQEFKENIEDYLNLDATLNYYVLCHTLNIADNNAKNLIFVTYDGKIWYPTLYDLDTTFGSYYHGLELYPTNYYLQMNHNRLFERLSILFKKEIEQRYKELRQNILSEENIINEIDEVYSQIEPSLFEKEQQKWDNYQDMN